MLTVVSEWSLFCYSTYMIENVQYLTSNNSQYICHKHQYTCPVVIVFG